MAETPKETPDWSEFSEAWRHFERRLPLLLSGLSVQSSDVDDLVQEALLVLMDMWPKNRDYFEASAVTTIKKKAQSYLNARIRREKRVSTRSGAALDVGFVRELTSPARAAVRKEAMDQISRWLTDPLDRQVLVMLAFDGVSIAECARFVQTPESTVRDHWLNLQARLRGFLGNL